MGKTLSQPALELLPPSPALSLCGSGRTGSVLSQSMGTKPSPRAAGSDLHHRTTGNLGWNGHLGTSAPVPPAQDRASPEVRPILKLNPVAQLLLQPNFQHFKAEIQSISQALWALVHVKPPVLGRVSPQSLSSFPCFRRCPLPPAMALPPLRTVLSSVPLHTFPPDPHCPSSPQALTSIPTEALPAGSAPARVALPHSVTAPCAWLFTLKETLTIPSPSQETPGHF